MIRRIFLVLICFLVLIPAVCAQNETNVLLTLMNVNTNENIIGVAADVKLGESSSLQYVDEENILEFTLEAGNYSLTIKADDPSTEGKDYFKKQEITVGKSLVTAIYMFPSGSLRGTVKDTFENVVGNAELRFECANEIGTDLPEKTNKFGSFMVDYMPIGSCKIFATFGEAVGSKEIYVYQGNITDVEILLDKTIIYIPRKDYNILAVVIVLFIIVAVLLFFRFRRQPAKKQKKKISKETKAEESSEKEKAAKTGRAKDIISTLNKKEKDIVEFLLSQKEETNQARIRHNTGIPRTSLSRILVSLEQKNIVKIKKVGKVVKVRLTGWFLGKE